jgi:hypothetical protein
VGKNAKLGIAAGVAVVLALICMVVLGSPLIGVGVLILGGLGVAALYQRLPDDEGHGSDDDGGGVTVKKKKQLQGKKRLDALIEGGTTETKPKTRPSAAPPAGGGLPTWSGPDVSAADDIEVVDEAPAADWDTWDSEWAGDADGDTITEDAANPLDNLDQLDDIDPIAEVERLDALDEDEFDALGGLDLEEDDVVVLESVEEDEEPVAADSGASSGGAFSFTSAPVVINEDVESADDIMAASQATELELDEDAADSELAKLLAKVQARLAAYE